MINIIEARELRLGKDRRGIFILEGSILILLGFIVWLYTHSVILGLELLTNSDATHEELILYSNSLQWWRLQQVTMLNPLAIMLIAAGIVLLGNAIFWLAKPAGQMGAKKEVSRLK